MMRLTFARPAAKMVKTFDQDEITLVPEEGLDSNLSLNESLPSEWKLPWGAFARLTLTLEADGTLLATNVSGDPAIKYKGNVLTSAYILEGDHVALGDLEIIWGAEEELSGLELDKLIAEAEALLEKPPTPPAPLAAPIAEKIAERRTAAERNRAYTAASVAIALFIAILSLGIFLRVDTERPATVIDEWAFERSQALRPITQEIVKLFEANTTRPTPKFHSQLETLLIRYDQLHDEQAHILAAQLTETENLPSQALGSADARPADEEG